MADMAVAAPMLGTSILASPILGPIQQGQAEANAAEYNAKVAEQNAAVSLAQSKEEERRSRVIARKQLGDIRASYGATGVTLEGSALDVLESSAANAEMDALTIRSKGEGKAQVFRNEAALDRYRAKSARIAGYIGGASALVGMGSKAAAAGAGG